MIRSVTTSSRLLILFSVTSMAEKVPMAEEEFFFGLDPWPNVDIDMGFPVLYPHNNQSYI